MNFPESHPASMQSFLEGLWIQIRIPSSMAQAQSWNQPLRHFESLAQPLCWYDLLLCTQSWTLDWNKWRLQHTSNFILRWCEQYCILSRKSYNEAPKNHIYWIANARWTSGKIGSFGINLDGHTSFRPHAHTMNGQLSKCLECTVAH